MEAVTGVLVAISGAVMGVVAILGFAIVPACFLWMVAFRRVDVATPIDRGEACPCGYDLAGLRPDSVCPECGALPEVRHLRVRIGFVLRPWGLFHLAIVMLPLYLTGVVAQEGLARGYERIGFTPARGASYAADDDGPGMSGRLRGVMILAAVAALSRRLLPGRRSLTLILAAALLHALLYFAYSQDAHRRGLDITLELAPGLVFVTPIALAIVLGCAIVAYVREPVERVS